MDLLTPDTLQNRQMLLVFCNKRLYWTMSFFQRGNWKANQINEGAISRMLDVTAMLSQWPKASVFHDPESQIDLRINHLTLYTFRRWWMAHIYMLLLSSAWPLKIALLYKSTFTHIFAGGLLLIRPTNHSYTSTPSNSRVYFRGHFGTQGRGSNHRTNSLGSRRCL